MANVINALLIPATKFVARITQIAAIENDPGKPLSADVFELAEERFPRLWLI